MKLEFVLHGFIVKHFIGPEHTFPWVPTKENNSYSIDQIGFAFHSPESYKNQTNWYGYKIKKL